MRHWRNNTILNAAENNIKSQTNDIKLELKIRNKAIKNKNFPSEELIEEFLKVPKYPEVRTKWILPDINAFIVGINLKNIYILRYIHMLNDNTLIVICDG